MDEVSRFRRLNRRAPVRLGVPVPRRIDWIARLGIFVVAFIAGAVTFAVLPVGNIAALGTVAADPEAARFAACPDGSTPTCVIDGDTFRYRGDTVRIADIDTPEVRGFSCPAEKQRGDAATRRLTALLNEGPFTLGPYERDRDRYGRALRIVMRGGNSLGAVLVAEGHARVWDGSRHSWC